MKIGYVNPLPMNLGGGEIRLRHITKGMTERGHDVSVITRKYRGNFYCKDPWYELVEVGPAISELSPATIVPFLLGSIAKLDGYDILDMSNPYSNFLHRFAKIRNPETKMVCTIHHVTRFKQYKSASRALSPFAIFLDRANLFLHYDKIVTVSSSSKEEIIRTGIKPDLIAVIPNGVDQDLFNSVDVDGKYPVPTLVSTSRLSREKNIHVLIESLHHLKKDLPDAQLVLIGHGKDRARLENVVSDFHLEDSVRFAGYISEEEKIRTLKKSHVFCFASDSEGFGIAPLEGSMCGLPLVLNDMPVLREVFGTAALYANGPIGFAGATGRLLTDSSLYESCSEKSRRMAKEYTWDDCVIKLENLYESLL